ncbi:MAG: glycosyltransferase family 4 protein [Solirubrobacterales bacterium]
MKVLIFHGYLLSGTGSNVYNASLASALARLGHEVHLLCQERDPPRLGSGPGSVTLHRPDIGRLLPVFVRDRYEGFEVKTFGELSDEELDAYIAANVAAVREVAAGAGGVDAALANHLVMGPVILRRAGLRYAVKVHGSDLSYTVLPELERFGPYAGEGARAANGILVGSGHIAARLREAVPDPAVQAKVRLGPPGVDTELFAPMDVALREQRLRDLAAGLRQVGDGVGGDAGDAGDPRGLGGKRQHGWRNPPSPRDRGAWDRDVAAAAEAVEWFAGALGPRVVFIGKLIVSKGVDLLLAAWPLIHARHPTARLLIVGFGALEPALRRVAAGLATADLAPLRDLSEAGRGLDGGKEGRLPILADFLEGLPTNYLDAARESAGSVAFAGRLTHDEVGALVPACDALVFPSTFPEAFGMVAAEAASAGVLPVSAAHSGAAEVSRALAAELPPATAELLSFELDGNAIAAIADRVGRWLEISDRERERTRAALREAVRRRWSWEQVARGVLAASAGDLDSPSRAPVSDFWRYPPIR